MMLGKEAGTEARVRVFACERLYKDEACTRVVVQTQHNWGVSVRPRESGQASQWLPAGFAV
jgi:hypothetical protein